MKRKYTTAMVKDLMELRQQGLVFSEIAKRLSKKYKTKLTEASARSVFGREDGRAPVPEKKPRRLLTEFGDLHRNASNRNERILFISDMHIPYHHPDTFAFLAALKKKYKPTRVVCVGDEVDKHAMSFHDSDPDLPSAGDELQLAINFLRELYKLFPAVDLVSSNHGDLLYRKGKHHGIPRKYLRDYGEVLDAPKGWVWSHDLTLILPDGNELYVHHGLSKNGLKVANQRGTCFVQGHHHATCDIQYSGNPHSLLWSMTVGCSIDKTALAFAYDNTNLARPIISHAMVIEGHPRLMPMVLEVGGRWNGFVP